MEATLFAASRFVGAGGLDTERRPPHSQGPAAHRGAADAAVMLGAGCPTSCVSSSQASVLRVYSRQYPVKSVNSHVGSRRAVATGKQVQSQTEDWRSLHCLALVCLRAVRRWTSKTSSSNVMAMIPTEIHGQHVRTSCTIWTNW